jgi:uncharacterized HAD superfamily protein
MNNIWKIQYDFNKKFFESKNIDFENLTDEQKNLYTKEFILHISREIFEVLNEVPFKMHRDYKDFKSKRSNIVEELIDVQKYLWGLFQIWNVDEEEFKEEFIRKSRVVQQRYNQEFNFSISKNKRIVIFDIDGVIADYPNSLIEFINKKYHKNFTNMFEVKDSLNPVDLFSIKDEYRSCGVKKFIKAKKDVVDFINNINREKYCIILLTSRPYSKYFRIYADTLYWLTENKINYDMIFWDEKKDRKILNNFDLSKIEFMIEDNRYYANKISQIGVKVFLLNNIYNEGICQKNVIRINNINEIDHELF